MGLDIYAGTLTRYYSHNWKTVVQQWAEENGYSFNRITPDGEPADNEEELSSAEVQAAVENWRDQILAAISQPNQPPYTPWPEDNERPYHHLPLKEKQRIVEKIHIPQKTICEDVTEHYQFWRDFVNPNKEDCCNLRKTHH